MWRMCSDKARCSDHVEGARGLLFPAELREFPAPINIVTHVALTVITPWTGATELPDANSEVSLRSRYSQVNIAQLALDFRWHGVRRGGTELVLLQNGGGGLHVRHTQSITMSMQPQL